MKSATQVRFGALATRSRSTRSDPTAISPCWTATEPQRGPCRGDLPLVADHFREYGAVQIDGEEPALVFASEGGGHLFALAGSGRIWRSTTASWFDRFDLAAASVLEFLEGLSRQISSPI